MDIFLIIGLVLGAICIMLALILKGASVAMLLNGEVAVIIFGGMIAAVLSSYTMADIKRLPKVMKVLMSNEEPDLNGTIEKMVELSNIARREGLLALEAPVNELDDPFMKQGLELVVDGAEAEQIRDLMESEVDAMETRHHRMSGLFKTAGATSPTLGVMGAAIGLIGALGNLSRHQQIRTDDCFGLCCDDLWYLHGLFGHDAVRNAFGSQKRRRSFA